MMAKPANFQIILETSTHVVIYDRGPWGIHSTVTNDAEGVVRQLLPCLNGRRLFYFDSEMELDELVVKDGRFAGFRAVTRR
jgi:hypothetical protein